MLVIGNEDKFWGDVLITGNLTDTEFWKKYSPGSLVAEFEARIEKPEKGRELYQITLPPPAVKTVYATKPEWDGFGSTNKKFRFLILSGE